MKKMILIITICFLAVSCVKIIEPQYKTTEITGKLRYVHGGIYPPTDWGLVLNVISNGQIVEQYSVEQGKTNFTNYINHTVTMRGIVSKKFYLPDGNDILDSTIFLHNAVLIKVH